MWNLFKVSTNDNKAMSMTSFCFRYCYHWTDFTRCSGVSIFDFEQVNASQDISSCNLVKKCLICFYFHFGKPQKLDISSLTHYCTQPENIRTWFFHVFMRYRKRPVAWNESRVIAAGIVLESLLKKYVPTFSLTRNILKKTGNDGLSKW